MARWLKLYSERGIVILVNLLAVASSIMSQQHEPKMGRVRREIGFAPLKVTGMARYNVVPQFGSNRQEFRLLVDTGASTTWIPSHLANSDEWSLHPRFNLTASESATFLYIPFFRRYLVADAEGHLMIDDIRLGGSLIEQVKFGAIVKAPILAATRLFDGVLGLALTESDPNIQYTFIDHLPLRDVSLHRRFALVYRQCEAADGYLIFGDDVEQHIPGQIVYVSLISQQHWRIEASWMYLGNSAFYIASYELALDTGASITLVPQEMLTSINRALGVYELRGNQNAVDCRELNSLPYLELYTSGFRLLVAPSQYILQKTIQGAPACYSPFFPKQTDDNILIIGNSILHAFDMVFDADAKKVGFAPRDLHSYAIEL